LNGGGFWVAASESFEWPKVFGIFGFDLFEWPQFSRFLHTLTEPGRSPAVPISGESELVDDTGIFF
jgi:hypothetical protein